MLGKLLILTLSLLLTPLSWASIHLKNGHPHEYTVQKGDTLWDISGKFLDDPWEWPELWEKNPQIRNPHLIYPGDELTLHIVNGQPKLVVSRGGPVKLSPRIRTKQLHTAIPPIPLSDIKPFLTKSKVLSKDILEKAAYVVGFQGDHVVGGMGNSVFAKDLKNQKLRSYALYRNNGAYIDPETHKVLGYAALHVGDGQIQEKGDPAIVYLTAANQEVMIGDRVCPADTSHVTTAFYPRTPRTKVQGQIISVLGGVTQIGQHQVVVLNRGYSNNLRVGDVLAIKKKGRTITDPVRRDKARFITLPGERRGELMVFRTFENLSYALVLQATNAINVLDLVTNPERA